MKDRLLKFLIISTGLIVTLATLLFFVRDTSRIINWNASGFVLSSILAQPDNPVTFWFADTADYVAPPYPARFDTLLTIDDSTATLQHWIDVLELPHEPGKEAVFTFLHDGEVQTTTIKSRPVSRTNFWIVVSQLILRFFLFLAFIILAFWSFWKRSQSTGIRAFTMYCFSMASFMGLTFMPIFAQVSTIQIPLEFPLRGVLTAISVFFSSFWLLLNLWFPRKSDLLNRRPWLAYSYCFLPQVLVMVLSSTPLSTTNWMGFFFYAVVVSQVLAGHYILRRKHLKTTINLEKRQTKLVFWGSGGSLIIFLIYILDHFSIIALFRAMPLVWHLGVINVSFLLVLASPLSFAYAFGRYRLLEVEARLRRGTRYLALTSALVVAFLAVAYLVGVMLLESLGIASRTPTLIIALFLALGFAPIQRRIKRRMELRFFPERERLRRMVDEFLQTASSLPDCASLCNGLAATMQDTLAVKSAITVLWNHNEKIFQWGPQRTPVNIDPQGDLVTFLRSARYPLLIDEALASSQISFSDDEKSWLSQHQAALILPLRMNAEMIGFLALGSKTDHEDFHPEELRLLSTLSGQIALSIQNLNLLEENIEKRRMQEELELARSVQLHFLPRDLPATPGLEIDARSTFCHEVAGDYYDVIALPGGKTLIAVGDVSGKGAGAALIMANLQASLRAYAGIGLPLREMMSKINDLILSNTNPDQYITLFVGVFDPDGRKFTYVNAGHNPPLVWRQGSQEQFLHTGGLIIGALPDRQYDQEDMFLQTGDLLVVYTDGISESMDQEGEEYGEEGIIRYLANTRFDTPGRIIEGLVEDVTEFQGGQPRGDDLTLMIARVQ